MKFLKEKERQNDFLHYKGDQSSLDNTRINVQEMVQAHDEILIEKLRKQPCKITQLKQIIR